MKHGLAFFFGDADTTVLNNKARGLKGQANKTGVGVVQGIAQQVAHDRVQEGRVIERVQRMTRFVDQRQPLGLNGSAPQTDQPFGDGAEIDLG